VVALKAQQAGENSGTAAARALPHFQQALACDPLDVMAGLNLTECLAALRARSALVQARLGPHGPAGGRVRGLLSRRGNTPTGRSCS